MSSRPSRAASCRCTAAAPWVRELLAHGLVDELILLVVPVILGQGLKLFAGSGPDIALELVESRVDAKGVTIQRYRPGGRPRYPAPSR